MLSQGTSAGEQGVKEDTECASSLQRRPSKEHTGVRAKEQKEIQGVF